MGTRRKESREVKQEELNLLMASLCLASAGVATILLAPAEYENTLFWFGLFSILLGFLIAGVVGYRRSGYKVILLPAVIYILLGTTMLFLIYKLESLAIEVGAARKVPGFSEYEAKEWHNGEMWLSIAFPLSVPPLMLYAVSILLYAVVSAGLLFLIELTGTVLQKLSHVFWRMIDPLLNAVGWLLNACQRVINAVIQSISGIFDGLFGIVLLLSRKFYQLILDGIILPVIQVWQIIGLFLRSAMAWIGSAVSYFWKSFLGVLKVAWMEITGPIGELLSWLVTSLSIVWCWFVEAIRNVWLGINAGMRLLLVRILIPVWSAARQSAMIAWSLLAGVYRTIGGCLLWCKQVVSSALLVTWELLTRLRRLVLAPFRAFLVGIASLFEAAFRGSIRLVEMAWHLLSWPFIYALNLLASLVSVSLKWIKRFVEILWEVLIHPFVRFSKWLMSLIAAAWKWAVLTAQQGWYLLSRPVLALWTWISSNLLALRIRMAHLAFKAWALLMRPIRAAGMAVSEIVERIGRSAAAAVRSIRGQVSTALAAMISSVMSLLWKIRLQVSESAREIQKWVIGLTR